MHNQIQKYIYKLISDRSAKPEMIAFAAQDDVMISSGEPSLAKIATDTLARLNCLALCAAQSTLPFAEFLLQRAADPAVAQALQGAVRSEEAVVACSPGRAA